MNMANVKMEHACVWLGGMVNTAHKKVVQTAVQIMVSAGWIKTACGSAGVQTDGMAKTACLLYTSRCV